MQCPGQDTRYWKPGDIFEIDCPQCGNKVEFFKDEGTRRCKVCKNMVVNPRMDFGCAAYCQFAAQCLGELGPEVLARRSDLLKDRVGLEVKRRLGHDFGRIAHVIRVARYAEEIARGEKAGPALALCVAYLHVFDESQTGMNAAPEDRTARDILEVLGADHALAEKVLETIDRFALGDPGDSVDAKVFFDAHLAASLEETKSEGPKGSGRSTEGELSFHTDSGRAIFSRLSV